jgi:hypothetical protein
MRTNANCNNGGRSLLACGICERGGAGVQDATQIAKQKTKATAKDDFCIALPDIPQALQDLYAATGLHSEACDTLKTTERREAERCCRERGRRERNAASDEVSGRRSGADGVTGVP